MTSDTLDVEVRSDMTKANDEIIEETMMMS